MPEPAEKQEDLGFGMTDFVGSETTQTEDSTESSQEGTPLDTQEQKSEETQIATTQMKTDSEDRQTEVKDKEVAVKEAAVILEDIAGREDRANGSERDSS